jgi:ATP-binding cassette subfamily B protein
MIKALMAIGDKSSRRALKVFLILAAINGLTQGAALAALVPLLVSMFRRDTHGMWLWLVVLAVAALINAVFVVLSSNHSFAVTVDVIRDMQGRLADHMVRLPLGWFGGNAQATASGIAVSGTMSVALTISDALIPVVTAVTVPIAVAIVALAFNWQIGLALVIAIPVVALVTRWGERRNAKAEAGIHEAEFETDRRLLEFADQQVVLRSAGIHGTQYQPLASAIAARRKAGRKSLWSSIVSMIPQRIVIDFVFGIAAGLGVLQAVSGDVDPVAIIAVIALTSQVINPLRVLAELLTTLRRAELQLDEVADVLNEPEMAVPELSRAQPADNAVQLDHVIFGYGDRAPVLDGVDLELEPGTVTALVGPSGSGKTTVTRLIARFWDANQGAVRIGGVDVKDLSDEDRAAQLSLVFQDVYLFNESLRENIALGDPDASESEVLHAAELAQVTPIAERIPGGWAGSVGEGGKLLSGGERQRVSIARALLKKAPILLLDEATAALDGVTAKAIRTTIESLRGQVTVLIIAHQAETIANADRVAFLEHGCISALGTHQELFASNPRYAAFWSGRAQAQQWQLG